MLQKAQRSYFWEESGNKWSIAEWIGRDEQLYYTCGVLIPGIKEYTPVPIANAVAKVLLDLKAATPATALLASEPWKVTEIERLGVWINCGEGANGIFVPFSQACYVGLGPFSTKDANL